MCELPDQKRGGSSFRWVFDLKIYCLADIFKIALWRSRNPSLGYTESSVAPVVLAEALS